MMIPNTRSNREFELHFREKRRRYLYMESTDHHHKSKKEQLNTTISKSNFYNDLKTEWLPSSLKYDLTKREMETETETETETLNIADLEPQKRVLRSRTRNRLATDFDNYISPKATPTKPEEIDQGDNGNSLKLNTPNLTHEDESLHRNRGDNQTNGGISVGGNGVLTPSLSPRTTKRPLLTSIGKTLDTNEYENDTMQEMGSPRKKLNFDESLTTPSSPQGKSHSGNIYTLIKKQLKETNDSFGNCDQDQQGRATLQSRETEYQRIMQFLTTVANSGKSNSLYITGPPGTGKTAQVKKIMDCYISSGNERSGNLLCEEINENDKQYFTDLNSKKHECQVISINCMSLKNPKTIYSQLYNGFNRKVHAPLEIKLEELQEFFRSKKNVTFIVILDEIDYLCNGSILNKPILIDLFLATKSENYKLVLIGISNSLDMTDKFLSRLKLDINLQPDSIVFKPYTQDQIYDIISGKLKSIANATSIIQPMAIRFLAKKMSSSTGDLRKVLDILRRAIEMLELEEMKLHNTSFSKDKASQKHNQDALVKSPIQHKKITVAHIAKACNYEIDSSNTKSRIAKLNFHQKVILICLIHKHKNNGLGTFSVDECYDYYYQRLTKDIPDLLAPLSRIDYGEITNTLEMMGLCSITIGQNQSKMSQSPNKNKSKTGSPSKVKYSTKLLTSQIQYDQLLRDMGDAGILNKLL